MKLLEETMASVEQIKAAKLLGKRLRKVREDRGFNLAILASKLKFTVVELVAIEDGNLYAFDNSSERFSEAAHLYAVEIGANLLEPPNSIEKLKTVTAKEWEVSIPHFLRKKD